MSHSFRRVALALGLASMAATVHGAWFATPDTAVDAAPVASVRVSVWDSYQQEWASQFLVSGQTFKGAEGDIIELRPEVAGDSIAAMPAFLEAIALNAPPQSACQTLAVACTIPVPNPANPLLAAAGTPVYGRLRLSQTVYGAAAPSPGAPAVEVPTPTEHDLQAVDTNGSVDLQAVTLNVGADAVSFTWDVSRWAKGDVFVGLNQASYKVLDRHGEFKRYIASADYGRVDMYGGDTGPITTGCAANWHTGEVYMTNFGDFDPAVNVITRQPGTGVQPYADPARRLSTAIWRSDDAAARANGDWVYPIDASPESIVFDGNQNMLVGHSFPHYGTGDEFIMDANYLPLENFGLIVDELGAVVMTRPIGSSGAYVEVVDGQDSNRLAMDGNGALMFTTQLYTWGSGVGESATLTLPTAYWEDVVSAVLLESQSNPGNPIPAPRPLGKRLHRYNNQGTPSAPVYVETARDIFWTYVSRQGTDWIDLSSDQSTVFYTSENAYIHRYNSVTGQQLPDLGTGPIRRLGNVPVGESVPALDRFHALRILPPGDGSGGFIVAAGTGVLRLDENGVVIQRYQAVNDPDVIQYTSGTGGLVQFMYALEVDPGGRTFWAAGRDSGYIYQFDLASGAMLQRQRAVEYRPRGHVDAPSGRRVEGICIMWEYTAAQEVCDDGIDNDNDGFVDESCTAIESCSTLSPGDDDGDGFSDHNDTDCGEERPPQALDDEYVINQGDSLVLAANGVMSNDSDPDNLDGDPLNNDPVVVSEVGDAPGTLSTLNVGAGMATAQGGTATLAANGSLMYSPPTPTFHGLDTFVYQVNDGASDSNTATVTIRVRPLVGDDSYTMLQMGTLTVGGLDASPAGILTTDSVQPMHLSGAGPAAATPFTGSTTFTPASAPAGGGQITVFDNGNFTYVPPTAFVGVISFVYRGNDGDSDSTNTATVTITVLDVNELVAVDDGVFNTPAATAIVRNLKINDRDPEGHDFQIVAIEGEAITVGGTVTITGATVELLDIAGNVRITPATGFSGLLTFTYDILDTPPAEMTPVTARAEVRVNVAAPPVGGVDDRYTTQQNTPVTVPAPGVLANDHGSGVLTVHAAGLAPVLAVLGGSPVTGPTEHQGTFTLSPDGTLTFTPRLNFVGTDTFKYTLRDDTNQVSVGVTVWIEVTPISTTLVTTPSPSTYGGNVNMTAAVTCGASQSPSAGTVTFLQGATVLVAGVPVVNGVATAPWPASFAVGTYPVTAVYAGAVGQCPGSNDDTTHEVIPAPLTITANPQTKVYGDTFSFDGDEFTPSGLFFSDTVTSATLTTAGAAATATVAGSAYPITPSAAVGTGLGNYTITYVDGPLTVTLRPLTITADDDSKVYGTLTTFDGTEFSSVGLVNGDIVATVTLASTGSPASTPANTTHPIVPTLAVGTGLDNYGITYVNGTLTVGAKALTITAANQDKTYGSTFAFDGTEFTTVGLQAGDTVTTVSLSSAGAVNTATVAGGPYAIAAVDAIGTGIDNYTVTYVPGTLTVNRAPLTVTADAQTKPYGMTFSFDGNEFTTAGLLLTDTVDGATLTSAGAAPTATVAGGPYPITPSAAVGTGLENYTIAYVDGPMTVTAIPLTITAADRTKEYGTTAAFAGTEFSVSGLVNTDAVATVTLASTGAPAATPANTSHAIEGSAAAGTGLANYVITYVDGTLDVTPKAATVTAGSGTKIIGTLDPALTTTQSGFLAFDLPAITLQTTRTAGETVGGYPTSATAVGAPLTNYIVTYEPGNFTITNRPPVAVNDSAATTATIPVAIPVLLNDSEPDGHTITIESYTQPVGGTVTEAAGIFTFVANLGFFGPTTFTYTITDGWGLTSTATVTVTVQSAGGAYRTQTQGGWGSNPSGNNPGAFLAANFTTVFSAGYVQVGGTHTLRFTSAAAVAAFLPAGGKAGKLTSSAVNPTKSKGGVFAGQVLALQISVAFSNAGVTKYGLASLQVQSGELAGYTVAQVLALANSVLGGGALPSGLTLSELNDIVDRINNNFVDGTTDLGYLQ